MASIARLSLAEYDRMIACGIFDGEHRRRIELIRGELRQMNPIGPAHEVVVDRLTEWSVKGLPPGRAWVRVQNSIGLPELDAVPEPDVAWVVRRDYSQGRPAAADVLLVVEVSDSSLAYDRGEKADLYAAAGIVEYWVVNLPEQSIEVRRDPSHGRYRTLRTYTADEELRPISVSEIAVRGTMLWQTR